MKWLQWSKSNLETGLGGVEVHARCLARELRILGVDAYFSSDPRDLRNDDWDVIHTHGSGFATSHSRAVSVHTLHGTTLGRMAACGEWLWPGGYLAEMREIEGVLRSDLSLSVHPNLSLLKLARSLRKPTAVCGNGWDAGEEASSSPSPVLEILSKLDRSRPFWLYIGRGDDIVKGADRVRALLAHTGDIQLVAAPGTGFEEMKGVIRTGRLDSSQIRSLMVEAHGLLVPSRYEGNSLVVLEALALGLHVLSTPVGAVGVLPGEVMGLEVLTSTSAEEVLRAIRRTEESFPNIQLRHARMHTNQKILPRWRDVARVALDAVETLRSRKRS